MEHWTVETLLEQLAARKNKGQVFQWTVQLKELDREESYFIRSDATLALDQSRSVHDSNIFLRVEVEKKGKLGSAKCQLFPALPLVDQLERVTATAALGEENPWSLETSPKSTELQIFHRADPLIWEDLGSASRKLSEELIESIQKVEEGEFNSAELFVSKESHTLFLSNGFRAQQTAAQVYAEVCFSDRDQNQSEEFMVTKFGASRGDLNFYDMCAKSAKHAKNSLRTVRPESGTYAMLIDSAALCQLFGDLISQLNLGAKYYGTPFIERGEELIPGFDGSDFKLYIDPEMNHTFGSSSYDVYGGEQKKLLLVDSNKVLQNTVDKKISSYLETPVTSTMGAVVVEPAKSLSVEKLRKQAPRVLEILQFSALFSSSVDLTFASEIRLARLHNNETGEVTYIKGGSIAGRFKESFKSVLWSEKMNLANLDEMSGKQAYYGPSHALLFGVPVTA